MKKLLPIVFLSIAFCGMFVSCSISKKANTATQKEVVIIPPEGVEFNKLTNYRIFSNLYVPYSGHGFVYANSTSVYKDDAGTTTRRSTLQNGELIISPKNYGKDICTFDEDIAILERVVLEKQKNEGKYIVEKRTIGDKQVAYFELVIGKFTTMGYLVENGSKAALIYAKVALQDDAERKAKIDEVFNYMIKTLKFREYSGK